MGEPMTDRRFKDIAVQGFTPEYESISLMMYRDSTFDLAQIQTTMRHLYQDNLSRSNEAKGRIADAVSPCRRRQLFAITVTR